ncbi:hypothetical protein [Vallitalea maricola]|uniref:Uncharacterized protein n=1 Tax=Vallitalea maricola TaxID=3074433 RepID=A0ACB5UQK9_9FIRM|nr:hypothetical protein AN2V17_41370 [Vallitalea sp. AN17-2]
MNNVRVKNVFLFINICITLVLIFGYYNQYSRANKIFIFSEVANSNTLTAVGMSIRNIHGNLERNIFKDNASENDVNRALLVIQGEIKQIEVLSRSFVRSGVEKYDSDSTILGRLSTGLSNYFQDIDRIVHYSPEKKEQLLLNLNDLQNKIKELNSNSEYSTEERLHVFITYIQEYDGWDTRLKSEIFEMMFY